MPNASHLAFIRHHLICLNDRCTTPSTASSLQSAIYCFFEFFVSSHFLHIIQLLRPSPSSSSRLLYRSFSNVFKKAVPTQVLPIQLAFLRFIVCRKFLFSLTVCNTFSYDRSDRSSPAFFSNVFQNFVWLDFPDNIWRSSGMWRRA
jgi:hypothetical protein